MIILSIKPKYAELILSGKKRWEFRKRRLSTGERVLLYATAPIKRIVGEITFIGSVSINEDNLSIFEKIKKEAGITEEDFLNYFKEKKGYMMRISPVVKRLDVDPKSADKNFQAPQSWKRSDLEL